jgi:Zn-dependent peptidase ImmA (M78 family)
MTVKNARNIAQRSLDLGWDGSLPVDPVRLASRLVVRLKRSDGEMERVAIVVRQAPGVEMQGASSKASIERTEQGLQYVIVFNKDEISYRNRFAVAHELAHLMLGHMTEGSAPLIHHSYSGGTRVDDLANAFATTLLLPEKMARFLFPSAKSIQQFATAFGVANEAAIARVKELRLL